MANGVHVMVNVLFYVGLGAVVMNAVFMFTPGKMKPEAIALPFMCFAAATGHFLGF